MDRATLHEGFAHYNATHRSVFLLEIEDGAVRLAGKPGFRVREEFNDSRAPLADEAGLVFKEEFLRAEAYRAFLQRVLADSGMRPSATIAIDTNDKPVSDAPIPILAFQKPRGANTILIPDIDLLHFHFFAAAEYWDSRPYGLKTPSAVFAGSTTCGYTITEEDVRTLSVERLRAAVFFKDKAGVDFRLPRIIQCASRTVEEMIEALGVGAGICSWPEQFCHRLILSMDGNGATCSRVAIALRSNSVLVKYASPHLLYYFDELVPWRHYIPVSTDQEVLELVASESRYPGVFESIAGESRRFAESFLSRDGVTAYAATLIGMYLACFGFTEPPRLNVRWRDASETGARLGQGDSQQRSDLASRMDLGAHIQDVGDSWVWPGEWVGECGSGRALEGIIIALSGQFPRDSITYRAVLTDGGLSPWVNAGELCGTRGQNKPLKGFCLRLNGRAAENYDCTYEASFTDGRTTGPIMAGETCVAEGGAFLEALLITVALKPNTAADLDRPPTTNRSERNQ